jgi:hypothetical protein
LVYDWFKTQWFSSPLVQSAIPPHAKDGALDLIESLHMRREHWALCCHLDVADHDTRVNTFVEVQNHILMDVVHVHATMSMQTMVAKEDIVQSRKDRKFAHQNFRTMTTSVSIMKEKAEASLTKLCAVMQDVVTPHMGKLMTKQVELALTCLENVNSTWYVCKCPQDCKVCEEYMTGPQKLLLFQGKRVIVYHVTMRTGEEDQCKIQHCSLGAEWETLHTTVPTMKHTRIITAESKENGFFLFICSCGYGFRYQCTCRHVAMILIHASDNVCAGYEIENIALRNTAAFAACRDTSLIKRTARDWKGTLCSHVTEESLRICPGTDHDDDGEDCDRDDGNDQRDGQRQERTRQSTDERRLKSERDAEIESLQDKFYRIKAKLEVAAAHQNAEFWTFAANVNTHLLAAFESLNGVPDAARTVVAHRYRDDPKRRQRPKTPPPKRTCTPPKRPAAVAGGGHASQTPLYAVIDISDSEDVKELRNGGAPSDDDDF